jgi:uncharacterized membrane protein
MQPAAIARYLIALSVAAFGAEHLIFGAFVTRVAPDLPSWMPWHTFWAWLTGTALLAGAAGIARGHRRTAIVFGISILLAALLLHLPIALRNPTNGGDWTNFGKGLTLAGCLFIVARTLPGPKLSPPLERLLACGKYFLAAFLVLCGVEHFLYAEFVASLIPPWIPWHSFWTYFAGIALIAGGLGIAVPRTTALACRLSGWMILAWVPLVHIPLALHDWKQPAQVVPVFEALAFGCAAVLVAWVQASRPVPGERQLARAVN